MAVQTLYGFYTVSVGKTFLQGSGCDDFFSYIALEGCHQVVMLKVTSKDKDERKGKQKKNKCVVCKNREQPKNHIKDNENGSLKELPVVLKTLRYKKGDGRVIKTSFPKSCEAIQQWFPSNQNM